MTDILRLLYSRHCIQDFLIYKAAFTCICIYRKVSHAKRGEVLEEVSTLTRIDIVILQSHLYDNPGSADMRPLYRYTQIMVAGTPTARTYQHIVLAVSKELAVDSFYIIGYIKIIHRREVVIILHINHINHIFADAMTQRIVRTQQAVGIRDSLHIFIKHLLGIDDRTNLKKIEFASPVIIDIAGKLYLHRSAHSPCSILHRHLQYLWQRHHSMLEHT